MAKIFAQAEQYYEFCSTRKTPSIETDPIYRSKLFRFGEKALGSIPLVKPENIYVSDHLRLIREKAKVSIWDFKVLERTSPSRRVGFRQEYISAAIQGLYLETEFGEEFEGVTVVTTRRKLFGTRSYLASFRHLDASFKSESPNFDRQFQVYTTSQREARRALKTNVMLRLLALASLNENIYLHLEGKKAQVYLDTKEDFFEYDFFAPKPLSPSTQSIQLQAQFEKQIELPIATTLLLNPRLSHRIEKQKN